MHGMVYVHFLLCAVLCLLLVVIFLPSDEATLMGVLAVILGNKVVVDSNVYF